MAKETEEKKKSAADKKVTVDSVLSAINKKMGEGTVYKYADFTGVENERIPTGIFSLDILSGGGWARGLMNYISGWESSGKSTACLYAIKETQAMGLKAAYIDHEYSFDKTYAESLGVNVDELIVTQPNTMEEGYDILIQLAESGLFGAIIFDSIAAAEPRKSLEGDVGDQSMGVKAKLNSETYPKICRSIKKTNTMLLMVNQLRSKIGIVYGSPDTEPGGNANKFYPSIKIDVRQGTKEKDGDEVVGNLIKAKCGKNKTSHPFREAEYTITYGEGIDRNYEIVNFSLKLGFMTKAGSWIKYGETTVGQGAYGAAEVLKDNVELAQELEAKIKTHYGL